MEQMGAFQAQQTLVYLQGRKAYNVGRSINSNPYTAGSFKSEGWLNGWRDASQGAGAKGFQATSDSRFCSGSGSMKTTGLLYSPCPECGNLVEIRREGQLRKHSSAKRP